VRGTPDIKNPTNPTQEISMKRLALVAAVLVLAACSSKENANPDTTTPATTPAPTTTPAADTGMKMDSTHKMDSTAAKADTSKKADATKKAPATKKP
jgi:ABC-type glycerol-3-phosphate transport system substrate-binding protein